jgi:AcrR family transcriptional regulator
VRRTRKALLDALLALMIDKGYEAISVQDIIDRADVGRSTFYTHYTDKDDLMQDGLADFRTIVEQSETAPHDGRRILNFSLNIPPHSRTSALALPCSPGPPAHPCSATSNSPRRRHRASLPDRRKRRTRPAPCRQALVRYVVGTYLSLLGWWLSTDPPSTPEEIGRTFRARRARNPDRDPPRHMTGKSATMTALVDAGAVTASLGGHRSAQGR